MVSTSVGRGPYARGASAPPPGAVAVAGVAVGVGVEVVAGDGVEAAPTPPAAAGWPLAVAMTVAAARGRTLAGDRTARRATGVEGRLATAGARDRECRRMAGESLIKEARDRRMADRWVAVKRVGDAEGDAGGGCRDRQ